uniref:MRPR1 n=1 Tax=Arundo donax TaxID=35708 RepID=A0A0A8XWI2_ARUDO
MAEAIFLALSKIGTTLADEATRVVISRLSAKATNLKVIPGKIEEIRRELVMMNTVVQRIGTSYLTDTVLKGWIAEVRVLAYRVEDVMDKLTYHVLQIMEGNFLVKYFMRANGIMVFTEISNEILQIEKEIKQVMKLKVELLEPSRLVPDQIGYIRKQGNYGFLELLKDYDVVGVEDNRRLLTEWLYSNEPDNTLITVSGMGGLGKTTLVSNVYEREKASFHAHAWIVVSQSYDVGALLRRLLRKIRYIDSAHVDRMNEYELKEEIRTRLKDGKCLIVLDDVWDKKIFLETHEAFQNHHATRVIITTRNEDVAALAPSTRRLRLQPLGSTDAFNLFCKWAFPGRKYHDCPEVLMELATDIVDRCQGVPLAITSIGSLLSSRQQTEHVWMQVYRQLRTELLKNDNVWSILNLSYHDLSADLRNCFLYCSLFPEDYTLSRENIVRLWVAEGFVVRKEQSTPEDVAEGNLMELIQRNMLEVVENDELGNVSTFKMHAILRDLALSVAREERFGSANDYGTMLMVNKEARRLSTCGWRDNSASRVKFPNLRTLVSLGTISSSPDMLFSILSESKYLTVLELQDSNIVDVPASIGNLFNVRYIGLRRTNVKSLPESIGKLSNLHTLDIKQTKIENLPRGIVKVKKLRYLLADRYADEEQSEFRFFCGVKAPRGLSNLEELQTLETVEASKDLAEQLMKLMQLRSLWIDNISSADCIMLFEVLSKMPLLSSLLLSASDEHQILCFESLKPTSTNLSRLIIRGCWAHETLESPIFLEHGRYLKYLALSWCRLCDDPLRVLASHLPNLTYLSLNRVFSPDKLVLSAGCFPHLKTLVLKRVTGVNQLKIMDDALPCIEGLYIVSCLNLETIPQGIESLTSLKKLWLLGLHRNFKRQWDEAGMQQKMQYVVELRL